MKSICIVKCPNCLGEGTEYTPQERMWNAYKIYNDVPEEKEEDMRKEFIDERYPEHYPWDKFDNRTQECSICDGAGEIGKLIDINKHIMQLLDQNR